MVSRVSRREVLAGIALAPGLLRSAEKLTPGANDFRSFAPTPPMGWNSWDSFGPTIREQEARANAEIMARRLLPFGYDIFTIDIQWYEPGANGYEYRKGAELSLDEWGRLVPADRNTKILGSTHRAGEIADRARVCAWNTDMYGIDMSKPGAQAYYDSVIRLYASWGVDFIKADDMSRPYLHNAREIHAVRAAIDRCGRPIILSLSPGETPLEAAEDVRRSANLWRISDDFWDTWPALLEQFARLRRWSPYRRSGNWPDADMLPLGVIDLGRRRTRLSAAEQVTLMTLWSIARSPLIMGGDLRKLDDSTLQLLTRDGVLAVNQRSDGNREVRNQAGLAVWQARDAGNGAQYVALFNLRDSTPAASSAPVPVALAELGLRGPARVRDLWKRADLDDARETFAPQIPCHGAGLFRLIT